MFKVDEDDYSSPKSVVEDDGGPQPSAAQNGRGDGGEVQII